MKRWFCILLSVTMLVGLVGCGDSNTDSAPQQPSTQQEEYVPLEPLTYTELPTALKAEKVGTLPREATATDGGLYYKDGDKYGIMTLDGKVDSGAVYALCQPKGAYFIVAKKVGDTADVTSANVVGLVDATGREIVPLQYASVDLIGERFARVAELTDRTDKEEEKLTQFTEDGKTVMCTGNWYLYDLKTGAPVPGATGTKPYISFDCGGYVKYVLDDKTVVVATPDGKVLPEEPVHLKNGHYAVKSEHTVYDSDGNKKFTYDPKGYVPVDSGAVSDYIVAEKQGKYVLLDEDGKVASAVFDHKPVQYGELFHVGESLVSLDGTAVVKSGCERAFWEPIYGQCWAVNDGKTTKVVDKTGRILYENKVKGSMVDTMQMMCYQSGEDKRYYYSVKDKGYTIGGIGLAAFLVKKPKGDTKYDVVNVLSGETVLSGYADYKVSDAGDTLLYVYAKTVDGIVDVFVVR